MIVEQAIFTSARSHRAQGYHVVASSPGIDETILRHLATWGPSHASMLRDECDAQSWNYHPLTEEHVAVSRTVHGGAEYSARGGHLVFTHFLIVRREDLAGFDNNALVLARTGQVLGYLRLLSSYANDLPALEFPSHPLVDGLNTAEVDVTILQDVMRILRFGNRLMVIGAPDPLAFLTRILHETPSRDRIDITFSTLLRPSMHRTFRIHFAPHADGNLHRLLASQGIDYVNCV